MSQKGILTKYNGIQYLPTPGSNNFEGLNAQECTHMNDIAYHLCPDLKKKKKKDWPIDPPRFEAKKANKPFAF